MIASVIEYQYVRKSSGYLLDAYSLVRDQRSGTLRILAIPNTPNS
jgi:hypothetical protein